MRILLFFLLFALTSQFGRSQDVKLFDSYLKGNDLETRYVVVLSDNTIWWFAPGDNWQQSSSLGLPDKSIKHISCYSHIDGGSRYVVVLSDNTIWWFAPGNSWTKSSTVGLPNGFQIKSFKAYSKNDGTRYTAVLADNSIWWFAPGSGWKKSSTTGLP